MAEKKEREPYLITTDLMPGDVVYIKHDPDQDLYMVTGILVRGHDVQFELVCGSHRQWCYIWEISWTKNYSLD